ncbi:transcriptional regulator [Paractinoplanes lichenicola]|uniref:Transcriptional regulator n=1 Tax=Paractinoplanes lichenicola TaxID=2802976 RepID=A0ABS1VM34_9ACTN|nr:transcriptional regulator [Actinoplanes lichenicola]MBL7255710.1 transcriptional regulator [Actinoplanes lichenicola]
MNVVLHTLRCIGHADLSRIAATAGLPEAHVESELIDLAVDGLATRSMGAWGLTAAGKAADAKQTADELDTSGARAAVTSAYETFLVLNPELLDLCSLWQLRDDTIDPARVLDRFTDLNRRVQPVLAALPRLTRYGGRLDAALHRARAGAMEELTDSMTSYHVIWFQLHEDLLATLGIPRT